MGSSREFATAFDWHERRCAARECAALLTRLYGEPDPALAPDEQTFLVIEALIERLNDEARRRYKHIDAPNRSGAAPCMPANWRRIRHIRPSDKKA